MSDERIAAPEATSLLEGERAAGGGVGGMAVRTKAMAGRPVAGSVVKAGARPRRPSTDASTSSSSHYILTPAPAPACAQRRRVRARCIGVVDTEITKRSCSQSMRGVGGLGGHL